MAYEQPINSNHDKLELQIPVALSAALSTSKCYCTFSLPLLFRQESRFAEAELILKEWLLVAEKLEGNQSILVGEISSALGWVYHHMNMYNERQ